MRPTDEVAKSSRSSDSSNHPADTRPMATPSDDRTRPAFVVCLDDGGHPLSLEPRKVYRTLADPLAEGHQMLRVVDDTGEDYLFPAKLFAPVELPENAIAALTELGRRPVVARRPPEGAASAVTRPPRPPGSA